MGYQFLEVFFVVVVVVPLRLDLFSFLFPFLEGLKAGLTMQERKRTTASGID